jgi:hypothetical protein
MRAVGGIIVFALTLLVVGRAGAETLYTLETADDGLRYLDSIATLAYLGVSTVDGAPDAGRLGPIAVAPEPSGLAALAIVMVALGVSAVMRLVREVRTLLVRCARYRIELEGVQHWWAAHRRHAG